MSEDHIEESPQEGRVGYVYSWKGERYLEGKEIGITEASDSKRWDEKWRAWVYDQPDLGRRHPDFKFFVTPEVGVMKGGKIYDRKGTILGVYERISSPHGSEHTIIFFPAKGALIPLKEWVGSKKGSEDVDEYKRDPIRYAADNARFLEEAFSTQAITEERRNKLLDKYLSLIIKYDRQAWKPFDEPKNGYPEYLSDGFSNLGSDVEVDSKKRWGREKLNVDKAEIFSQSRDFLRKTIADALDDLEKVKAVASYVYNNIRYGDPFALIPEGQSIVISKYLDEGLGVCRHQAMYTQVLLQTLGVRSMLFPNKLNGGKHLSNLVLIGDTWFLLDVTSPKNKHLPAPKKEAYLVEVGSRVELSPEEISKIRLVVKDGDRVYMSDPRAAYWRIRPR